MVYDSGAYHAVMERVLALGDWDGLSRRAARRRERRGKCRGIGVANYVDTATGVPRERAEITVQPRRRASKSSSARCRSGQGHETSFAQLVTEWLGVPLDSVRLVTGDTDARLGRRRLAFRPRAAARQHRHAERRRTTIIAKGMRIAGHAAGSRDRPIIEFAAGRFRVKGTDRADRHLRGRAPRRRSATICRTICAARCTAIGDETVNLASFPYGCHVCEVEVDPETGVVEIVRYARGR